MLSGYKVASLYGLDTLGMLELYKDKLVNNYYVEQEYNGMCGREKYFTIFTEKELASEVVVVNGYKFRVVWNKV